MAQKGIAVFSLCLFLVACAVDNEIAMATMPTAGMMRSTLSPTSLFTPIPSADYQSTLDAVQGTAAAVMQLQIGATAAQDERLHEWAMAQAEQTRLAQELDLERQRGTATAAPTVIPITQTARMEQMRVENERAALAAAAFTATAQAPDLARDMHAAEMSVYFGVSEIVVRVAIGLGVLFGGVGIAFKWLVAWRREQAAAEVDARAESVRWGPQADETRRELVITLKMPSGMRRDVLPVADEMMVEYADRVALGESPAINHFEGGETSWTRETYRALRRWMLQVSFARVINNRGEIELTEEGKRFFEMVQRAGTTPPLYVFSSVYVQNAGDIAHNRPLMIDSEGEGGEEYDEAA